MPIWSLRLFCSKVRRKWCQQDGLGFTSCAWADPSNIQTIKLCTWKEWNGILLALLQLECICTASLWLPSRQEWMTRHTFPPYEHWEVDVPLEATWIMLCWMFAEHRFLFQTREVCHESGVGKDVISWSMTLANLFGHPFHQSTIQSYLHNIAQQPLFTGLQCTVVLHALPHQLWKK